MDTMQDVATAGAQAQADIDAALAAADEAAGRLVDITKRGVELGMVTGIAAKRILGAARSARGGLGAVAADFADLHVQQTKICKENSVDTGTLITAGGVALPNGGGR